MTIASHYHRRLQVVLMLLLLLALIGWGCWLRAQARLQPHEEPPPVPPAAAQAQPVAAPQAPTPPPVEDTLWPRLSDAIKAAAPATTRLDEVSQREGRVAIRGTIFSEAEENVFPQVRHYFEQLERLEQLEALRLETFQMRQADGLLAPQFLLSAMVRTPQDTAPLRAADTSTFWLIETLINTARHEHLDVRQAIPLTLDRATLTIRLRFAAESSDVSRYLSHLARVAPNCTGLPGASSDNLMSSEMTCRLQ